MKVRRLSNSRARRAEAAKRRRELVVALVAILIVATIFVVEYRVASSVEDLPLSSHLLLFALLSVAILLLILVLFFLIRNLFKLIFERRQKILGSHLKTRLTLAFVALTLIPTIVLFLASAGALHTTIETWFRTQVEDSLQSSLVVAQTYYQSTTDNVLGIAGRVASVVPTRLLFDPERRDELAKSLESARKADGLSAIRVVFRDDSAQVLAQDPALGSLVLPAPRSSFLDIAFQGERTSKVRPLEEGGELIRAIVPIKPKDSSQVPAVVVADYYIPTSLAGRLFSISNAYGEYQEAKRMMGPVKTIYVLILLMVALLVILIGSWFGMSMARDITDPMQHLAEGTEKVAAGNLDVYIEPVADDELGVLVRSFNKMTADLRTSRDELVRVNQDLDGRRKYMETVLKSVAAGVLAIDSDHRITAVNSPARNLLGIEEPEILGKDVVAVLPEVSASQVVEILQDLGNLGSETLERQLNVSFPDRSLSLICFASGLNDDEGGNLGAVLVFEDMTYLVKAQRMAAWRDVARRIAHEIKNPLTPIQLNAQRIRRKYMDVLAGDSDVLDQCTKAIVDQVEQLKNMVNEFSSFARMPSAKPAPNDLNEVVKEVVDLYVQANELITFTFEPAPHIPVFDLDKEQIQRVMVNLLDNAVSAVADRGSVAVSTRFDPELSMAVIEVADSGTGVSPRDRDRLFEPYFSRKPGGTGLGLTIVNTIVSDHSGFIRLRENEGGGAKFIVELPVKRDPDVFSSSRS